MSTFLIAPPVFQKASLVTQWVKEVSKWLGSERLIATALVSVSLTVDDDAQGWIHRLEAKKPNFSEQRGIRCHFDFQAPQPCWLAEAGPPCDLVRWGRGASNNLIMGQGGIVTRSMISSHPSQSSVISNPDHRRFETLKKYSAELHGCCDLLVCDEAHRLKTTGPNKTVDALLSLGCKRRVLLTGTPVQNNLDEFYGEYGN